MAARFSDLVAAAKVAAFVKSAQGRYIYVNQYLLATMGRPDVAQWLGKTDVEIWPPDVAARIGEEERAVLDERTFAAYTLAMPLEDGPHTFLVTKFPMPTSDGLMGLAGVGVDITQHLNTEAERDRLAAAVEQAVESILITDLSGRITYVNPAFELATGYTRQEAIGQNPRFLKSGVHPVSFYEAMWAVITSGKAWSGDVVNRRKDGSLFTEEARISPMRGPEGEVTGYVGVKHDVTAERALADESSRMARKRALIAQTLRDLRAGDTPEITAQAICRQVASLPGIAAAQLLLFELDGHAMPIGFVVGGRRDPKLARLPYQHSRQLFGRAAEGPWIEPWMNRQGYPYNQLLAGVGVRSLAYAPVRYDGQLIGLLVVQATDPVDKAAISEVLPALVEFADLAGALVGRDVAERTEIGRCREYIAAIIETKAFTPVFQPIVELGHDGIVGYEALTRFADGADPEGVFAKAAAVGLGAELETATLEAALVDAEALPRTAWLNLNASPELIVAGDVLRALLADSRRRLVLEVTEHTAVADYPAFRAAIAALGTNVEIAVDDAGSGFSSLRHIVELRPGFVKLDRSLVAGLADDESRQAMIVGLRYFARAIGCRLIAEGIETAEELTVLRALDIGLGQGYLLGRPAPVEVA
jgi:PAS domain S-box-containing protein